MSPDASNILINEIQEYAPIFTMTARELRQLISNLIVIITLFSI